MCNLHLHYVPIVKCERAMERAVKRGHPEVLGLFISFTSALCKHLLKEKHLFVSSLEVGEIFVGGGSIPYCAAYLFKTKPLLFLLFRTHWYNKHKNNSTNFVM